MRQLLTPAFSARRMQALRPRIGELVDTLLDQLADQTPPADLHEALSFPLPALVICSPPRREGTSTTTGSLGWPPCCCSPVTRPL
jgi:hypothetical protein